jgi:hypothetical protein
MAGFGRSMCPLNVLHPSVRTYIQTWSVCTYVQSWDYGHLFTVVAMVEEVEVEAAVAGGVPFGPSNKIKIKSTLDNMLVHQI